MYKTLSILVVISLIPVLLNSQDCSTTVAPDSEFKSTNKYASYEVNWYPEWLEFTKGEKVYPDPLPLLEKWEQLVPNGDQKAKG